MTVSLIKQQYPRSDCLPNGDLLFAQCRTVKSYAEFTIYRHSVE